MTIAELKEEIAELPDDMEVMTESFDYRWQKERPDKANCVVAEMDWYDVNKGWVVIKGLKIY